MRKLIILTSLAFVMLQCEQPPDDTYLKEMARRIENILIELNTPPPIQKWEYEACDGWMDYAILNSYGESGWELVSHSQVVAHDGRGGTVIKSHYVFKRPLQ